MLDKDVVQEARRIVIAVHQLYATERTERLVSAVGALADEVERLKRGDFTPEEFQNLCHNTDIQAGFEAFADGCEAYQQKMFGRCRKGIPE